MEMWERDGIEQLKMCCRGELNFIFPGTWVLGGCSAMKTLKKDR